MGDCRNRPDAVAWIRGGVETPLVSGCVRFYQERGRVLVAARVSGLPESETGFFGFHIHQGDSCSGTDFSAAGSHYDPACQTHPKHAGDLPPLMGCGGSAYLVFRTDRFSVQDIIGKTVVIHRDSDDFHTQPGGSTGTKIACGVICNGCWAACRRCRLRA